MKTSDFMGAIAKAVAIGFFISFLSVIAAIVVAINYPTVHVSLGVHFIIWLFGAVIALAVMILRHRRGK
jgi:hypothetical protein